MAYKKTGDAGNGGGVAPTDTDDFIFSKFIPFAGDQGFVSNQAPTVGTAPNRECWIWQGTVGTPESPFIFIRTREESAFCFIGTGVDLGEDIYDQPGNPANGPINAAFPDPGTGNLSSYCPILKGSASTWAGHHLFSNANGDYIHAVCQLSAREWRHLWYGKMPDANKYGDWVGGEYMTATWWSYASGQVTDPLSVEHKGPGTIGSGNLGGRPQKQGFFRIEGLVPGVEWCAFNFITDLGINYTIEKFVGSVNTSVNVTTAFMCGTHFSFGGAPQVWGASLIARTTPLIPITIAVRFNYAGQDVFGMVGTLPDVYHVNMKEFSAGETITVGSDDYVVFPVSNNDTVSTTVGDNYSGYFGLAYKVIP